MGCHNSSRAHRHCKARHLIKSRLDYPHKITVAHSDDAWLPDWSSLGTSRLGGSRTAESMVARWPDAKNLKALHQRTWLPSSHRCIVRDPSRAEVHRLNADLIYSKMYPRVAPWRSPAG